MKNEEGKLDFRRKVTVARFGASDIDPDLEQLKEFKNIIEECDDNYPGIDLWFEKKVKPGLREKERGGVLIYHEGSAVGASVVRKGEDGKLCSLRIKPKYQKKGIGKLLMALSVLEFKKSEIIHFSVPASIWGSEKAFLERYGFTFAGKFKIQYRRGDDELFCTGSYGNALQRVLLDIPLLFAEFSINKNTEAAELILSIKPNFVTKIITGEKKIELRRRFSNKWEGAIAILYATHPYHEFVGEVKIEKVITGKPIDIWYEFGTELGCDRNTFFSYCDGLEAINALMLSDVKRFEMPLHISSVNRIIRTAYKDFKEITPPQSHSRVGNELLHPLAILHSSLFNFERPP